MTTLQQWKDKLIEVLNDTFYLKTEIDSKYTTLNNQINTKLNINDAFSGDYDDLINQPSIPSDTIDVVITYADDTTETLSLFYKQE